MILFLCAFSLVLSGIAEEKKEEANSNTSCDLKNIKRFYYCDQCSKILRGFKCLVCSKGKCTWYINKSRELAPSLQPPPPDQQDTPQQAEGRRRASKTLVDHLNTGYDIGRLQSLKCPCCEAQIKNMEEIDLLAGKKCQFCGADKPKQKEYCVKEVYGCADGHKGILLPKDYNNACPEVIDDANGKKKICKKPLEKIDVSFEEVIFKYICPSCQATSEKAEKCATCDKNFTKTKTCVKAGQFPHIDAKKWEKEQIAKRKEALK
jgi:hypothetical protein